MKSLFLVFACAFLSVVHLQGQSAGSGKGEDLLDRTGVHADSLLVANYYKLITSSKKEAGVSGYRILIFSDSGIGAKEEQQKIRARFISEFPGVDAYYRYDEPNFKVYVGDCRTRSEALKLHEQIEKKFPNSFIREDYINLK